jgi:glycosyltransferase involved in cell wall biosynthesis
LKIAIISTPIFRIPLTGYGGLEQIAYEQAKGLAARGHDVLLIAPDGSECPGAKVLPVGTAGQVDERMAFGGYREIKQGEQVVRRGFGGYWQALLDRDVILDHSWNKFSYSLKQEGRFLGPVLCWMHAPVDTMIKTLPPGIEKPCIVCISNDQRQQFEALFGKPARTCYNGIDIQDYYKPLGIPRTKRFLFLARFSAIKGPDLAIAACKEAGAELDLVGDTKLTGEAEYLQSILKLADGKQIRFVGPATRSECVHWFSQAHALIHPVKNFREPFGLAPVEAMACGCPVIAWDYGAMRETIGYDEPGRRVGWLVDTVQDLVSCIQAIKDDIDPKLRERCRVWSQQFSVQKMSERVEELCLEALKTGGW